MYIIVFSNEIKLKAKGRKMIEGITLEQCRKVMELLLQGFKETNKASTSFCEGNLMILGTEYMSYNKYGNYTLPPAQSKLLNVA